MFDIDQFDPSFLGGLLGITVISTLVTLTNIGGSSYILVKQGLQFFTIRLFLVIVQLAFLVSDIFRLVRAVEYYAFPYRNLNDAASIVRDSYRSFAIDATLVCLMLLMTAIRFHMFSIIFDLWMFIAILVAVVSAVFYVVLISLWCAAALGVVTIFQNGREGHFLIASTVFTIIVHCLLLIATSFAIYLTSQKAFRKSARRM